MSRLAYDWPLILNQAQNAGLPDQKQRGILREYLQARVLYHLYAQTEADRLSFIGGTSLRMLRGLRRFSEDLDFDNLGLSTEKITQLFQEITVQLKKENLPVDFTMQVTKPGVGHGHFRFVNSLQETKITTDPKEVLRIDLDYTTPRKPYPNELVLLSRFDSLRQVRTNTLSVLLLQKGEAFRQRPDVKGRDLYDMLFLCQQRVVPSDEDVRSFGYENREEWRDAMLRRYEEVQGNLPKLKRQLQPFLEREDEVNYLDLLSLVLKKLW